MKIYTNADLSRINDFMRNAFEFCSIQKALDYLVDEVEVDGLTALKVLGRQDAFVLDYKFELTLDDLALHRARVS